MGGQGGRKGKRSLVSGELDAKMKLSIRLQVKEMQRQRSEVEGKTKEEAIVHANSKNNESGMKLI